MPVTMLVFRISSGIAAVMLVFLGYLFWQYRPEPFAPLILAVAGLVGGIMLACLTLGAVYGVLASTRSPDPVWIVMLYTSGDPLTGSVLHGIYQTEELARQAGGWIVKRHYDVMPDGPSMRFMVMQQPVYTSKDLQLQES